MRLRSKCCNARIHAVGKTTMYHVCLKCLQPCDFVDIDQSKVVKTKKYLKDSINTIQRNK